jgi:hypothetical protein
MNKFFIKLSCIITTLCFHKIFVLPSPSATTVTVYQTQPQQPAASSSATVMQTYQKPVQPQPVPAPKSYWQSWQDSITDSIQSVAKTATQAQKQFNSTINYIFDQDAIMDAYVGGTDYPEGVDYDKIGKGLTQDVKEFPNRVFNETLQSAATYVSKVAEDAALAQSNSSSNVIPQQESSGMFSIKPETAQAMMRAKQDLVDAGIIISTKTVSKSLQAQEKPIIIKDASPAEPSFALQPQTQSPLAQAKEVAFAELKTSANKAAQYQLKGLSDEIEKFDPQTLFAPSKVSDKKPADSFFDANTVDALTILTETAKAKVDQTVQVAKEVAYNRALSGIKNSATSIFTSPFRQAQEFLSPKTESTTQPTFTAINKNKTQRNFYDAQGKVARTVIQEIDAQGTTTYIDKNADGVTQKVTMLLKDRSGIITEYKEGIPTRRQTFDNNGKLLATKNLHEPSSDDIYDAHTNMIEID